LTRNFVLCFFAQVSFTSVFHTLIPTLPIYLSQVGADEVEIGILIGALGVSSLILRPFVGRALLTIPEKKFMGTGAVLFALTSAAFLWISPFWPFLIVRIIQGIGFAFFYTATITLVASISPESHRGQSLSYFFMAFNVSFALFPSFGMFIINRFNFTFLFLICIGLSLCCLWVTSKLRVQSIHPVDSSTGEGGLFSRKALPPAIMYFFAHIIWGTLTAFFPLYSIQQGVSNPGYFFTAYAIVLLLSRALGGRILDLYSREKVMLPCLAAYVISMTILAFSKTLPWFIFVAVIWAIGNAFFLPSLVAYVIDLSGQARGPAMGVYTALGDLGTGLGPIIMGVILRFTNYPIMFLCLAFTALINLGYFYFFAKNRAKNSDTKRHDEPDIHNG
jgi:MFS family permease